MPNSTMVYVTHDQVEAMTLASRIVVLHGGDIEQVGPPLELYEKPANVFVARFIGSPAMNMLDGKVMATGAHTSVVTEAGGAATVPVPSKASDEDQRVMIGVRPEDLVETDGEDYLFEGHVDVIEALGETTNLYFQAQGKDAPLIAKLHGIRLFNRGDVVRLTADPAKVHLFDMNERSYHYR